MSDDNRIGSGPVDPEYVAEMTRISHAIDAVFNGDPSEGPREKKIGFILMVFEFGPSTPDHRCNYMSNASREDVIIMLKEQLAYFEGQSDRMRGRA